MTAVSVSWTRVTNVSAAIFVTVGVVNWVVYSGVLNRGSPFDDAIPTESTGGSLKAASRQCKYTGISSSRANACSSSSSRYDGHSFSSLSGSGVRGRFYPVCVLLSIGDDTPDPNDKAVPFPLLYRLFDAATEELYKLVREETNGKISKQSLGNDEHDDDDDEDDFGKGFPLKLLVAVDFPSLVCKMARDSLHDYGSGLRGLVGLTCKSLEQLQQPKNISNSSSSSTGISCGTAIVGKSTRYVPQITLDWVQLIAWDNLKVVDLDVRDASRDVPDLPREAWRPTVVTGFSANHIPVALLLLRSLGKAGMEARQAGQYNISVVVYTLEVFNSTMQGILECVVRELNEKYMIPTELRAFEFSLHPDWMKVNQSMHYDGVGKYAWKGIIIHTVLVERGFVLWADAGCRYTTQALTETLDYTKKVGLACKSSAGAVPRYVHHGTLKYYRYKVRYGPTRMINCDTSGVGLTLDTYDTLGRPFYDCSMTRQCIGPDGATRDVHRFDQPVFTLIVDINGASCSGLSPKVRRHMDYHPLDYVGTYPSECYRDPLEMEVEWV